MCDTPVSEPTGWHSLDAHCKAQVLSLLNPKDLCTVAAVSREDLLVASEPPIWQRKLKELFGLSVKGINPATYKGLYVGLAQRRIGTSESSCKPGATYPVRFKALYTDGGVDENLYQQYWCDLAFECNAWGAYCSKVSPNINVLSLIQTPSASEQATLQHRAFLADRCRFAAGRMLARVPLPPMDAPPTRRQVRYYAKAGATLLRWSTSALEMLYCALFASRRSLEPVSRSMELGLTQATAPGASTPGAGDAEAVEALLREKYHEILRLRLGSEGAETMKNSNPAEVLQALSAAYSAAAQATDVDPTAEHTVEDEKFMAGGSGGGQTGGIDPRNLCEDPHGLKVFDRKLMQKLGKPTDLASYTAVMDMIALSRSGNDLFTCPIRTGAVLLGSITAASPPAPAPGPPSSPFATQNLLSLRQRTEHDDPGDAAARAHLGRIVGQPRCAAFEDLNSAEAVFGAVAAGAAPPIMQYKLMPHYEFIEFAPPAPEEGHRRGSDQAPVPLEPVIWFRFFTRSEQDHLSAVDRLRRIEAAGSKGSHGLSSMHWSCMPPTQRAAFTAHLMQQQQQQYQQQQQHQPQQGQQNQSQQQVRRTSRKTGSQGQQQQQQQQHRSAQSKLASHQEQQQHQQQQSKHKGKSRNQAMHASQPCPQGSPAPQPATRPSSSKPRKGAPRAAAAVELHVPQQLVVMNAAGTQLEAHEVSSLLAAGARLGLEQAAWGWGMLQSQQKLIARRQQFTEGQREGHGAGPVGLTSEEMGEGTCGSEGESEAGSGSLMEEDLQHLQNALDENGDNGFGMEPPEDVNEMLAMMGYDDGHGQHGEWGAHSSQEGTDEDHSGPESSTGDGEEEQDTSDTEGHPGGHAPPSELDDDDDGGTADEEEQDWTQMEDEEEDDFDVASQFADIVDAAPPPMSERLLLTQLAQHVGLQLLMNTHTELEREGQLIVEQEMGLRTPGPSYESRGSDPHAGPSAADTAQGDQGGSSGKTGAAEARRQENRTPSMVSEAMQLLPGDETAQDSTALHDGGHELNRHPGLLQAPLSLPRAGNMVCLKLISPENKMAEMQDPHDDCNIDIQFAAFRGVSLQLRQGLQLTD